MNKTTRTRLEKAAAILHAHKLAIKNIQESLSDLGILDESLTRAVNALGEADTDIELALEGE